MSGLDAQHVAVVLAALIRMAGLVRNVPVLVLASFGLPAPRQHESEHDDGDGRCSHFSTPARASSSNRARAASSWRAV